jgi:hypothetical protein
MTPESAIEAVGAAARPTPAFLPAAAPGGDVAGTGAALRAIRRLLESGHDDRAEVLLRLVIDRDGPSLPACDLLSRIHLRPGEHWAAIEALERVPGLDRQADVLFRLSLLFFKLGLFFSARRLVDAASALAPGQADIAAFRARFAGAPDPPRVTFYVPCFNAAPYLHRCLAAILRQTYAPCEVLVVDAGSTDDSVAIARSFPGVIVVHQEGDRWLSAGRNIAFRRASGDLVAAVDSDVEVSRDWLERAVLRQVLGQVAGVGGRLIEANTVHITDCWRARHMKQNWGDEIRIDPPILYGADTLYSKAVVAAAGFYNEQLRVTGEDVGISQALYAAGHHLTYEPLALARHMRTDTLLSVLRTAWNWARPALEQTMAERDPDARPILAISPAWTRAKVEPDLAARRFDLLYPDLVETLTWPLFTLRFLAQQRRGTAAGKATGDTFVALKASLRFAFRKSRVPGPLADRLVAVLLAIDAGDARLDALAADEASLDRLLPLASEAGENLEDRLGPIADVDLFTVTGITESICTLIGGLDDEALLAMADVASRAHLEDSTGKGDTRPTMAIARLPQTGLKACSATDLPETGLKACPATDSADGRASPVAAQDFSPAQLQFTAALLSAAGVRAIAVDAVADQLDENDWFERLRGAEPRVLVIETTPVTLESDLRQLRRLKLARPATRIVLAGIPAKIAAEVLERCFQVDGIVVGEGDAALVGLAQATSQQASWSGVPGLAWRDGSRLVVPDRQDAGPASPGTPS